MIRPSSSPRGAPSTENTYTPANAAGMGNAGVTECAEELLTRGRTSEMEEVMFKLSAFDACNQRATFPKWTRVLGAREGASGTAGQHSWSQGQVDGVGEGLGNLTEARAPGPGLSG